MRIVMLLMTAASGYLSWLLVDGFLFAMAVFCLILAITVNHWTGKNG